ncbi:unnamed protein product [Ciceribacter sp. T2.26MG-112.2]|nr:unnamed protein product [Ciceribacter naphthalenivorans]
MGAAKRVVALTTQVFTLLEDLLKPASRCLVRQETERASG